MRRLAPLLSTALAGALHVAGFALLAPAGGGAPAGEDGAATITLQAAPEHLADLAEAWERPPEHTEDALSLAPEPFTPEAGPPLQAQPPAADPRPTRLRDTSLPQPEIRAPVPLPDSRPPAPRLQTDMALPVREGPEARDAAPLAPSPPLPDKPRVAQAAPPSFQPHDAPKPPEIDTQTARALIAPHTSKRPQMRPERPEKPAPTAASKRPATAPKAPSAPRAAQRAKGSSGTAGGTARTPAKAAPGPGPGAAALRDAQAHWGAGIRRAVARAQRYPSGTRAQGIVRLRITVSRSGKLAQVAITQSSGHAALDRAGVRAAQRARLPRAPKLLQNSSYSFNLPLNFATR